jgi:hypothetical protein
VSSLGACPLDLSDEDDAGKVNIVSDGVDVGTPVMKGSSCQDIPSSNPLISHSMSESTSMMDSSNVSTSLPDFRMSQSYDEANPTSLAKLVMEVDEALAKEDEDDNLKTPVPFETEARSSSDAAPKTTPKEMRRRFTFFRSAASVTPAKKEDDSATDHSTPAPPGARDTSDIQTPTSAGTGPGSTSTPTRGSLRARVMGLMGKTPTGTVLNNNKDTPGLGGLSLRDLSNAEDPFSNTSLEGSPETEDNSIIRGLGSIEDDSVEEAVEADELLVFDPATAGGEDPLDEMIHADESDGAVDDDQHQPGLLSQYWWIAALPLCLVFFIQLLPLPVWFVGFVTGVIVAAPLAVYGMYAGFVRDSSGAVGTKFIENVRKKMPKRAAIIVQEELERKYVSLFEYLYISVQLRSVPTDSINVRIIAQGPVSITFFWEVGLNYTNNLDFNFFWDIRSVAMQFESKTKYTLPLIMKKLRMAAGQGWVCIQS